MSPRWRTFLIGAVAAVLAVVVGVQIAQEEFFLAALIATGCTWALLSWVDGPRTEAWLLGFLIFAYIVGNRGFAQVTPVPGLPLFFAELGLGFAGTLFVFRSALTRASLWTSTEISTVLAFWIALGAGRIGIDVRTWGIAALRDFATVYYAGFFFVAVALCRQEASRRVLHGAITATFVVLPFTTLLADLFPRFFQTNLLIKGVPLILYKEDLAATYGYAGFLWLLVDRPGERAWWRWPLALTLLVNGLLGLSRASLAGVLVAAIGLAVAGQRRALATIAAVGLAGALLLTALALLPGGSFRETRGYAVYEAVMSVTDFSGTRAYRSGFSNDKGDNNRFRLVWWRNVAEETLRDGPWLGRGFGADLAKGFVSEYMPDTASEFVTRSPHNVFVTVLGRMGLLGVAAWTAFYAAHATATVRVWRAAGRTSERTPTLFAMTWVVMVSACFGVVLEGPMGAVPFWILLGLAYAARTAAAAEETSAASDERPAPERVETRHE
ncbi:MAG: O-antigen ligase family protein [Candidatus Didemnitutus sp.]|nr:O-antigen ligase family protein [Candidatus Didemnitutus sp.]